MFLLFPRQMGSALASMTIWYWAVYFGYKGTMKVRSLTSPFLAFFAAVVGYAFFELLFGIPEAETSIGMALWIGVPILVSFGTLRLFYGFEPIDSASHSEGG